MAPLRPPEPGAAAAATAAPPGPTPGSRPHRPYPQVQHPRARDGGGAVRPTRGQQYYPLARRPVTR